MATLTVRIPEKLRQGIQAISKSERVAVSDGILTWPTGGPGCRTGTYSPRISFAAGRTTRMLRITPFWFNAPLAVLSKPKLPQILL